MGGLGIGIPTSACDGGLIVNTPQYDLSYIWTDDFCELQKFFFCKAVKSVWFEDSV